MSATRSLGEATRSGCRVRSLHSDRSRWGWRAPGPHGPVGVGASTPEGRVRSVELAEPIERRPADATYTTAQPAPHEPAAVTLVQDLRGVEQAVERRVAVVGRERGGGGQ